MPDTEAEHEERNRPVQCVVCLRPEKAWRHDKVCPDCYRVAEGLPVGSILAVAKPTAAQRSFNGADPSCTACGGLGRHNGVDCICRRNGR